MPRYFQRIRPGGPISARELNRLQRSVESLQRVAGISGLRTGPTPVFSTSGLLLGSSVYQPFYARVVEANEGSKVSLRAAMTTSTTEIRVKHLSGSMPLSSPFYLIVDNETIKVTAHSGIEGIILGTTWRLTRAVAGTTAAAHAKGAILETVTRQYGFQEVYQDLGGRWLTHHEGRASTVSYSDDRLTKEIVIPAFETKGASVVPSDGSAIVQLWLGYDTQTYYLFEFFDSAIDEVDRFEVADDRTWVVRKELTQAMGNNSRDDTTLKIKDQGHFPSSGRFFIQVDSEIMLVDSGAGTTTWTVKRAQLGTKIARHAKGRAVTWILPDSVGDVSKITFKGQAFVQVGDEDGGAVHTEVAQFVYLVSGPDDNGLYDARLQEWNPRNSTWSDGIQIWVRDANATATAPDPNTVGVNEFGGLFEGLDT